MKALAHAVLLVLTFASGLALGQGALVTDVAGAVQIDKGHKLALLAEVAAGSRIRLDADGRATLLFLANGEEFVLRGPGRYEVGAAGVQVREGATPQRRGLPVGALAAPRLKSAGVAQATLVMRSLPSQPQPEALEPRDTWILEPQPQFRWAAVGGATGYRLTLRDANGDALFSGETADTALQLPASVVLEPGAAYSWSIEALPAERRGRPATAGFQIMEAERRAALEALRPGAGADFAARVTYALMLEKSGAAQAAARSWRDLAAERPGEPGLARRLAP
jgi:hypothetical protein